MNENIQTLAGEITDALRRRLPENLQLSFDLNSSYTTTVQFLSTEQVVAQRKAQAEGYARFFGYQATLVGPNEVILSAQAQAEIEQEQKRIMLGWEYGVQHASCSCSVPSNTALDTDISDFDQYLLDITTAIYSLADIPAQRKHSQARPLSRRKIRKCHLRKIYAARAAGRRRIRRREPGRNVQKLANHVTAAMRGLNTKAGRRYG